MERQRRIDIPTSERGERGRLQEALSYAGEGWPVFPVQYPVEGRCSCGHPDCSSPAKHPKTRNGLKDATTEEARINSWWRRYPEANIGIATGKTKFRQDVGLVVLDVDPRHGGNESLQALIQTHGRLPYTRMVLTGGGGRHYYFESSEDLRNTVSVNGLPGLDIRANGGYIIAPSSRHISGGTYRFARAEVPVATIPDWLSSMLRPESRQEHRVIQLPHSPQTEMIGVESAEACLQNALEKAIPGNRNTTGFMLACRLRDLGVEAWEAEEILRDYAAKVPRGERRYTVYEALASVRQAYKRRS